MKKSTFLLSLFAITNIFSTYSISGMEKHKSRAILAAKLAAAGSLAYVLATNLAIKYSNYVDGRVWNRTYGPLAVSLDSSKLGIKVDFPEVWDSYECVGEKKDIGTIGTANQRKGYEVYWVTK